MRRRSRTSGREGVFTPYFAPNASEYYFESRYLVPPGCDRLLLTFMIRFIQISISCTASQSSGRDSVVATFTPSIEHMLGLPLLHFPSTTPSMVDFFRLSFSALMMCPAINCHPGVSHAGRGIDVCSIHLREVKRW